MAKPRCHQFTFDLAMKIFQGKNVYKYQRRDDLITLNGEASERSNEFFAILGQRREEYYHHSGSNFTCIEPTILSYQERFSMVAFTFREGIDPRSIADLAIVLVS
jgi:hypothetical protein